MSKQLVEGLSRRERQIMDIIYQRGEATAADIQSALPEAPGNSAVRALLSLLKQKGLVRHRKKGRMYIYSPVVSRERARRTVLGRVVQTFFGNSVENVIAALIDMSSQKMSDEELTRLEKMIQQRREGGKSK
ncbi:MAG: BlaI/MecI/CopY family transcriptional regulator [Candidatus Zixiibacteriota bacterium]